MALLERAKPFLVHGQFGVKTVIPKNSGVSVNFRRFERLAYSTTALTEGSSGAAVVPTITSISVTVSQYGRLQLAVLKPRKFGEPPDRPMPSQPRFGGKCVESRHGGLPPSRWSRRAPITAGMS
jgi:hypothetical protein